MGKGRRFEFACVLGRQCAQGLDAAVVVNLHHRTGHRARPAVFAHAIVEPARVVARHAHVAVRLLARAAERVLRAVGAQRRQVAAAAAVGARQSRGGRRR